MREPATFTERFFTGSKNVFFFQIQNGGAGFLNTVTGLFSEKKLMGKNFFNGENTKDQRDKIDIIGQERSVIKQKIGKDQLSSNFSSKHRFDSLQKKSKTLSPKITTPTMSFIGQLLYLKRYKYLPKNHNTYHVSH